MSHKYLRSITFSRLTAGLLFIAGILHPMLSGAQASFPTPGRNDPPGQTNTRWCPNANGVIQIRCVYGYGLNDPLDPQQGDWRVAIADAVLNWNFIFLNHWPKEFELTGPFLYGPDSPGDCPSDPYTITFRMGATELGNVGTDCLQPPAVEIHDICDATKEPLVAVAKGAHYANIGPIIPGTDKHIHVSSVIDFNYTLYTNCPQLAPPLEQTATHELGHALGLKHYVQCNQPALMCSPSSAANINGQEECVLASIYGSPCSPDASPEFLSDPSVSSAFGATDISRHGRVKQGFGCQALPQPVQDYRLTDLVERTYELFIASNDQPFTLLARLHESDWPSGPYRCFFPTAQHNAVLGMRVLDGTTVVNESVLDYPIEIPAAAVSLEPSAPVAMEADSGATPTNPEFSYSLRNDRDPVLEWTMSTNVPWLAPLQASGAVGPHAVSDLGVQVATASTSLGVGVHRGTVIVTLLGSGEILSRSVELSIRAASEPLVLLPTDSLVAAGPPGGPFVPECKSYILSNSGIALLSWTAEALAPWLSANPAGGTLGPGQTSTIDVCVSASAATLLPGAYVGELHVTDVTSGVSQSRFARLSVSPVCPDIDRDGWTTCAGDCDDTDALIYPGAAELCDGRDNDCDGVIDNIGTLCAWQGSDGMLPTSTSCPWRLVDDEPTVDPVLSGDRVILSAPSSPGASMYYAQDASVLHMPPTFVIEAKVRVVSESHSAGSAYRGVSVGFVPTQNAGNVLFLGADEIFLWGQYGAQGPHLVVDTDDDFHTYRIEITGSVVSVIYDGTAALSGSLIGDSRWGTPNLFWGDGTGAATGTSEWTRFQHNARPSDFDRDGWTSCGGDCDDTNRDIHPGASEVCDGLDNDCNGKIDDGPFPCSSGPSTTVRWDAASGTLPSELSCPWTEVNNTASEPQIQNGRMTILTTAPTQNTYYIQSQGQLSIPADSLVLQFRVRFVSGSSLTSWRGPISIGIESPAEWGTDIFIDRREIFYLSANLTRGGTAPVVTDDALHTYRIVVAGTELRIYQDGLLRLHGSTFHGRSGDGFFAGYPRIDWGEGSLDAYGTSEWEYFQHNAGVPIGGPNLVRWSGNGHCYEAVYAPGLNWQQALDQCRNRCGYLATITSPEEECFIEALFEDNAAFWHIDGVGNALGPWTGGYQAFGSSEPGGGWGWFNGEPFTYTHWSSHDPDNCCNLNQNRIEFIRDHNVPPTRWTDVEHFAGFVRGYIFESSDCSSTTPVLSTPIACVYTPTLFSLVDTQVASNHVRLTWSGALPNVAPAYVYRRTTDSMWERIGTVRRIDSETFVYDDVDVSPGQRYGYKLGVVESDGENFLAETWITVPEAPKLALLDGPNPVTGTIHLSFALASSDPATLDLFDLAGRRVSHQEVGSLGLGTHSVSLNEGPLPPGVYRVRLQQKGVSASRRLVVLR
jgi:Putative metal-binding motif/Lectin C-type domain/Viral BACON domain